jgi:MFS family permease
MIGGLSHKHVYFKGDIPNGFSSLYTAKTINNIASGLLGVFLPIFLYELFQGNFQLVMAWYLIGSLAYLVLVAYGAQFLNRVGFRTSLIMSAILGSLFYTVFYFLEPKTVYWLIPLSIILLTIWRMTYWLPYHIEFTKLTKKRDRGKQLSLMLATASLIGIFAPVVAGTLITHQGYNVLFIIAIVLFLVSSVPYFTIPRTHETYSWSYTKTWKQLFRKSNQSMLIPLIAEGAENTVGVIIWPIFIFNILEGNYFEVGAVSTLIVAATIGIQLFAGSYVDGKGKRGLLRTGTVLYAFGWILKVFVATAFHIFVAGVYHSVMKIFVHTPFETLVYEVAADQGHYIDEFSALREMAIGIGKSLMLIMAILISIYTSIVWTFALAAVASLLFNLAYAQNTHSIEP